MKRKAQEGWVTHSNNVLKVQNNEMHDRRRVGRGSCSLLLLWVTPHSSKDASQAAALPVTGTLVIRKTVKVHTGSDEAERNE